MSNVSEILMAPREGETQEAHAQRCEVIEKTIKAALSGEAGGRLLNMLIEARHPMEPRFAMGRTETEAAFADGEASLIGWLLLNSGHRL